jgi:hypothetical protein
MNELPQSQLLIYQRTVWLTQQRLKLEAAEPDDFEKAIKSLPPPPAARESKPKTKRS